MGVMTTKDMNRQAQNVGGAETDVSASPLTRRAIHRVLFRNAPQGKSNAAFFHGHEERQVELADGFYTFADDAEKRELLNSMLKAGFVIADYWEGDPPEPPPEVHKRYRIRYAHPDNEPDKPKTGNVSMTVSHGRGKPKTEESFELDEHGTITTDDEDVQKHLEKLRWAEVSREVLTDVSEKIATRTGETI